MTDKTLPLIGITSSLHISRDVGMQSVTHFYLDAVKRYMGFPAILIPAGLAPEVAISRLDGILLTGSRSNVHPSHYGQTPTPAHEPFDEARDATTLPLIRAAIAADIPVLAICRGYQELNVACGGSLYSAVHELPDRLDHREPKDPPNQDVRFGANHAVHFPEDSTLRTIIGAAQAQVNSLHNQAIDKLGDNLRIEATAPDGTIEAIRHTKARFCLGVQWHPEHQPDNNTTSQPLFTAFKTALLKN